MNILYTEDLTDEIIDKSYSFTEDIKLNNETVYMLAEQLSETDCKELCDMLNMINNQGIININNKSYTYIVKDGDKEIRLGIASMSSSEALFLLCAIATKTKKHIIVSENARQLTHKTFKLFIRLFKDSPYITVVFDDEYLAWYYKEEVYN